MRSLYARSPLDPWAELFRMQNELSKLMRPTEPTMRAGVYPPANFYRSAEGYLLRLEMPGVDTSSLDITSQRNELSIAGERSAPVLEDKASHHRRERRFGKFRRTFSLPDTADGSRADASYRNGVLEIRLPLKPESQPRQIAINAQ